jgi:hypothetical protein
MERLLVLCILLNPTDVLWRDILSFEELIPIE